MGQWSPARPGPRGGWISRPATVVQGQWWGLGEGKGPVTGLLSGTPALTPLLWLLPCPWAELGDRALRPLLHDDTEPQHYLQAARIEGGATEQ